MNVISVAVVSFCFRAVPKVARGAGPSRALPVHDATDRLACEMSRPVVPCERGSLPPLSRSPARIFSKDMGKRKAPPCGRGEDFGGLPPAIVEDGATALDGFARLAHEFQIIFDLRAVAFTEEEATGRWKLARANCGL